MEGINWDDNSKEVEDFKKQSIAPYPNKPIGEAFTGDYSVTEWKYGQADKESYLLCYYIYEEQEYALIFYKDSYGNVNIAEYYIGDEAKDSDDIKSVAAEIFSDAEELEEDTNSADVTDSNANDSTEIAKSKEEEFGESNWFNCIESGTYRNNADDFYYEIEIETIDSYSFKFRIYSYSFALDKRELVFNEHIAEFDSPTDKYADYNGENYHLSFDTSINGQVQVDGFDILDVSNPYDGNY